MRPPRLSVLGNELKRFLAAYRSGMYPQFVFGANVAHNGLPVFCYHRIDCAAFEAHLRYLQRNAYSTLSADQIYECLAGRRPWSANKVALTFDDGLDDLYFVAFPLLRKLGFTAIAYIVPGRVGQPGFVNWPQVREMHKSGLVDIQSHSMNHRAIFVSDEIIDFVSPFFFRYADWDIPGTDGVDGATTGMACLGTPVYVWSSRLSDRRRYSPDPRLQEVCISYVAQDGGSAFFRDRRWRNRLQQVIADHERYQAMVDRYETAGEHEEAVRREIESARCSIEKVLPDKTIRHFAFPWNEAGRVASSILLDSGYRTVAVGLGGKYAHTSLGNGVIEIKRVSGDFVLTLPGSRRLHFWAIIARKVTRRICVGTTY